MTNLVSTVCKSFWSRQFERRLVANIDGNTNKVGSNLGMGCNSSLGRTCCLVRAQLYIFTLFQAFVFFPFLKEVRFGLLVHCTCHQTYCGPESNDTVAVFHCFGWFANKGFNWKPLLACFGNDLNFAQQRSMSALSVTRNGASNSRVDSESQQRESHLIAAKLFSCYTAKLL